MRGAPYAAAGFAPPVGIIPACAGSTSSPARSCAVEKDHPRVCGEHPCSAFRRERALGSSPRVRGALVVVTIQKSIRGIIPACAGSTLRGHRRQAGQGDHPRVCGEHTGRRAQSVLPPGSSPRVRGALRNKPKRGELLGIIPACAGSTVRHRIRPFFHRDHPRVCGEHFTLQMSASEPPGSSPRVRGALLEIPVQNSTAIVTGYKSINLRKR